jgi:hypothetical protein
LRAACSRNAVVAHRPVAEALARAEQQLDVVFHRAHAACHAVALEGVKLLVDPDLWMVLAEQRDRLPV